MREELLNKFEALEVSLRGGRTELLSPENERELARLMCFELEKWGRDRYFGEDFNLFEYFMIHYFSQGGHTFGNALPPPRRGGLRRTRRHRKHNRHTRRHRKHSRR